MCIRDRAIISVAQEKKVGYGETAEALRRISLIASALLMALMVAVLLVSQYVLHRQRKELIYRSKLFDSLSLSIDDAFIIRDAGTGVIGYRGLNLERILGIPMADVESLYPVSYTHLDVYKRQGEYHDSTIKRFSYKAANICFQHWRVLE